MKPNDPKSTKDEGRSQNPKSRLPLLLGAAVVALGLDQLTKALVVANVAGHQPVTVIEGFARLRYTENTGAAFGFFQGWTGILSIAAIAIIIVIVLQASKVSTSMLGMVAIGLITGGALGNLVDRLRLGYVVDFFEVYGPRITINNVHYTFPVFNVADSAITVGAILLMGTLIFGKEIPKSIPGNSDASQVDTAQGTSEDTIRALEIQNPMPPRPLAGLDLW